MERPEETVLGSRARGVCPSCRAARLNPTGKWGPGQEGLPEPFRASATEPPPSPALLGAPVPSILETPVIPSQGSTLSHDDPRQGMGVAGELPHAARASPAGSGLCPGRGQKK